MKRYLLILSVSFIAAITSCNNSETKNTDTTKIDTSAIPQKMDAWEMYTCTMHNEVMSDHPGKCPKCEMKLVKQKMTDGQMKMMQEGTYVKPKE